MAQSQSTTNYCIFPNTCHATNWVIYVVWEIGVENDDIDNWHMDGQFPFPNSEWVLRPSAVYPSQGY